MTRRETRVIESFLNCIKHGEFTPDYAIVLIEDNARYGWLSSTAKDFFYEQIDTLYPEPEEEPEPIEEPSEEPEEP